MEEKKATKISLSTFFLIIAIIAICVMGYFLYKLNNDKEIANNNAKELTNKVSGLESTINNLQGTINNISNTDKTENEGSVRNSNSTTQANTNISKSFSNEDIKIAIQNYLDLKGTLEGSPEGLLVKLGLTRFGANTEQTDGNYIKTSIKYSEYKNKMLNYMTEKCFEDNFTKLFKNKDGDLYFLNGGATGRRFIVKSINVKGDYSALSYIANVDIINIDESKEQENIEFHIENNNGKCVISYCD